MSKRKVLWIKVIVFAFMMLVISKSPLLARYEIIKVTKVYDEKSLEPDKKIKIHADVFAVKFKEGISSNEIEAFNTSMDVSEISFISGIGWYNLEVPEEINVMEIIERYDDSTLVQSVHFWGVGDPLREDAKFRDGEVTQFKAEQGRFILSFLNTSELDNIVKGKIKIFNAKRKVVAELTFSPEGTIILPNEERTFNIPWMKTFPAGIYRAVAEIDFGNKWEVYVEKIKFSISGTGIVEMK